MQNWTPPAPVNVTADKSAEEHGPFRFGILLIPQF